MIRDEFPDAGEQTPADLQAAYEETLAAVVETVGLEEVIAETELTEATVEALVGGESPEITVEQAANLFALDPDRPHADHIEAEARDILLLGMTTAVLDVEALSSGIDASMEPKAIQQKVEGRAPMTLDEYATMHQYIDEQSP
jgi:hypothetical protein